MFMWTTQFLIVLNGAAGFLLCILLYSQRASYSTLGGSPPHWSCWVTVSLCAVQATFFVGLYHFIRFQIHCVSSLGITNAHAASPPEFGMLDLGTRAPVPNETWSKFYVRICFPLSTVILPRHLAIAKRGALGVGVEMGTSPLVQCSIFTSYSADPQFGGPPPPVGAYSEAVLQLPCPASSRHCCWVGARRRGRGIKLSISSAAGQQTARNCQTAHVCLEVLNPNSMALLCHFYD